MIIKALNNLDPKYGYATEIEYKNDKFNGNQVGVCLAIQNAQTGVFEHNYISSVIGDDETRNTALQEILNNKSFIILTDTIYQRDDTSKELVPKTVYYLPYYVKDHSCFKPTVTFDNVSGACNVTYNLDVEVLFVEEGLNRYVTMHFCTRNIPVMSLVYDLFEDGDEEELAEQGIGYGTYEDETGFLLDFYNEAGEKFMCVFRDAEELRDRIVSIRLIGIDCKIDGHEDE